jgi:hypothetical protein
MWCLVRYNIIANDILELLGKKRGTVSAILK